MAKPNKFTGSTVTVGDMPFNVAMRKFKQNVNNLGILEDVRSHEFFEKPTTERKRKKGAAAARTKKQLRSQELPKKMY